MKKLFTVLLIFVSASFTNAQWIEQPTPPIAFNLFTASFPSANTGFAMGYGGRMIKTTNGGTNWYNTSIFPNTAVDVQTAWFINENSGWMTGSNDTLYRTTNSGVNWFFQQKLLSDAQAMLFINSSTGYILAQPRLYRTTDAGNSWTIINNAMGQYITFLNESTGWMANYVGAGQSIIYKTTNGGFSYFPQYTSENFRVIYDLDFVDENTGWAVGYREHILKTTNGGVNWIQQRDMNNSTPLYSVDFVNHNTGWVVGSVGYSLYTTNSGDSWNQVSLPVGSGHLHFINSTTGWIVGSRIFKTTTLGLIPRVLNLSALVEGFYDDAANVMVSDTMTVYLRNSKAPYNVIDESRSVVSASGTGSFSFVTAVNDEDYFLIISHRNSIDTWSPVPQQFKSNSLNYDLTISSSAAYGNNLKQKGSEWTVYSGDVNKDEFVNLADLVLTFNDASAFATGYLKTDVNGNNVTELADIIIIYNNAAGFVSVMKP